MDDKISLLRCKFAQLNVPCSYGDGCRFVHDDTEMERRQSLLRQKQAEKTRLARGVCHSYSTAVGCSYGDSCRFAHVEAAMAAAAVAKAERRQQRQLSRRSAPPTSTEDEVRGTSETDGSEEQELEQELRASPLYTHYPDLFEEAVSVLARWRGRFLGRPDIWARFTRRTDQRVSRVVKEFCESAPVLARVRRCVQALGEGGEPPVTIVDLCSGFGFMSMFLSEMLPRQNVHRIVLVDNRWSLGALRRDAAGDGAEGGAFGDGDKQKYISSDHVTGDFYEQWPIPLVASKQNIRSGSGLRSMQRVVVDRALGEGDLVLLGVHLCGVLSLRAVSLFNGNSDRVRLFALKPCCLPGLVHAQRNEVFSVGRHQFPACSVCASGKFESRSNTKERWHGPPRNHLEPKFLQWTDNLLQGIELHSTEDSCGVRFWSKEVEHIALQRVGYQNKYIWAELQTRARGEGSAAVLASATATAGVLQRQQKNCGHYCYPSSVPNCCACSDLRPLLSGDVYPCYTDGLGWTNTESRDAGYCPVCNPKNYEAWTQKIERERELKLLAKLKLAEEHEQQRRKEEEDKRRAAATHSEENESIVFEYSNGDVYTGQMVGGERCGRGRLAYADGAVYDGQWKGNKHEGHGTKDWCDGIVYVGEWKNGMMHGRGRYSMADGAELEGLFEEDEFAGYA